MVKKIYIFFCNCSNTSKIVSPHQPLENYHYSEELDMNDLFNFDTLMNTTQQNNNNNNVRHNSEWDQDKLDFFLKELI